MKKQIRIYFLLILLNFQYTTTNAQTFDCNQNLYLSLSESPFGNPEIHSVSPGLNAASFSLLNEDYNFPFNSIGYNVNDQLIYGLNPENYHLYVINAIGEITDLGIPENLNITDYDYYAGDMIPNGRRMILIGRDKLSGIDKVFFSVRFDLENTQAGSLSLLSENGTRLEDIAFDPVYGTLYGFDGLHKRIVTIDNSSGLISTYASSTYSNISSMGSLFFDEFGTLYGYGSQGSEESTLFKIDKFERNILATYEGPSGNISDGCSCPYRMLFFKSTSSDKVLPCSEIFVMYSTKNTAGTGYSQMTLLDSFPPEFTITEFIRPPGYGTIESGVGTNKLHVSGMDVLLNKDSIVIKIEIDENAEGIHSTHAKLGAFPMALGGELLSDNPKTLATKDPTVIEVLTEEYLLENEITFLCEDASITLSTSIENLEYLWNDGSTNASLDVNEAGVYWLEIANDCAIYRDSILVNAINSTLIVELGEDRWISQGAEISLDFFTNASTNFAISWSADSENLLSCLACEEPVLRPMATTIISVFIMDEYGCTASDEITIHVDKKVEIFAPNIFTPNFDGINDRFYLQGKSDFTIKKIAVLNRWGAVVHYFENGKINFQDHAWDGDFKGQPESNGVYLWYAIIEMPDGTIHQEAGNITLVR